MKNNNKTEMESGFHIENLILMDSSFKRASFVTFDQPDIKQNIDVDVNVSVNDNMVYVTEHLKYTQIYNDTEEVVCSIIMTGIFKKIGESEIDDLEQFGQINGAAIIFPYIREHLTTLSAKAGLGLIILPPINFTKVVHKKSK